MGELVPGREGPEIDCGYGLELGILRVLIGDIVLAEGVGHTGVLLGHDGGYIVHELGPGDVAANRVVEGRPATNTHFLSSCVLQLVERDSLRVLEVIRSRNRTPLFIVLAATSEAGYRERAAEARVVSSRRETRRRGTATPMARNKTPRIPPTITSFGEFTSHIR